ncbi:unnamed protein product, partial [Larinioides sclopetarius]
KYSAVRCTLKTEQSFSQQIEQKLHHELTIFTSSREVYSPTDVLKKTTLEWRRASLSTIANGSQ